MTSYTSSPQLFSDHNGIIRLYDGTVVYIVDIEYSSDGKTFWEKRFNPAAHNYEYDNQVQLAGHKWMRVKHAQDIHWQAPMYIQATDGKTPEFRLEGTILQWGFADDNDSWKNLFDISTLKGEQGDVGPEGRGLAVNAVGWYGEFIDSMPSASTVTSCRPCSAKSDGLPAVYLVLSLGDGNHVMTSGDQVSGKFRSNDGLTWIPIGVNDIGRKTRFLAEDINGANYIDYRRTNNQWPTTAGPAYTQGRVYAYADGMWIEMDGMTTQNYLVAPSVLKPTTGKFMEDYESDTIGLDAEDNLEVKDESIDTAKLKNGTFTHGLEEGATIKVNPDELAGFGMRVFNSDALSEKKFQVYASDFAGNGLATITDVVPIGSGSPPADGEYRIVAIVNPDALINNLSGLITETQLDGYKDFKVKAADCIEVDADGVNVKGDELTIWALDQTTAKVYPTDNNSKGIQAKHIHANVANVNKGLQKGPSVLDALEIKKEDDILAFNGQGELTIAENGVNGIHLNDNTVDETRGLLIFENKIIVKLEENGGLEFNGVGEIRVSTEDIIENNAVTSLNGKVNDVVITASNTAGTGITLGIEDNFIAPNTDKINVKLTVDKTALTSFLDIASPTNVDHGHSITAIENLPETLASKVTVNTLYDNVVIDTQLGLLMRSDGGKYFKVVISEVGDLTSIEVAGPSAFTPPIVTRIDDYLTA